MAPLYQMVCDYCHVMCSSTVPVRIRLPGRAEAYGVGHCYACLSCRKTKLKGRYKIAKDEMQ